MIFFMVRLRNETLNELPYKVTSPDWLMLLLKKSPYHQSPTDERESKSSLLMMFALINSNALSARGNRYYFFLI